VTTMADMNFSVTMLIFHISGIVGCETLLWILLPVFWKCAAKPPNLELQEASQP
ncbi:hypothetical protein L195_g018238, partial [Trifolium pratense]